MEGTIGVVKIFAGNFAPRNWAFCKGQILPIAQNTALFSIIGTIYGGDGRSTMGLPNLQGRAPIGEGRGPGLSSYRLGERTGQETVTLNSTQIPNHSHIVTSATLKASESTVRSVEPVGNYLPENGGPIYTDAAPNIALAANSIDVTIGSTGGGQPHENRSPYIAMNYIVCLQGIFPSRS